MRVKNITIYCKTRAAISMWPFSFLGGKGWVCWFCNLDKQENVPRLVQSEHEAVTVWC